MKFKVPDTFTGSIIDSDGEFYIKGVDGTVDIPDDKVHDGFYGYGFERVEVVAQEKVASRFSDE